jgi:acyl-CoA thioesterase
MNLAGILAAATPTATGFRATIPGTWHQGRTAFGGLSAALSLQAAMQVGGELPPLRSAQVSFVGPVAGEVEVAARVLRQGRNATWIAAEILSGGSVCLTTTFVFMGAVESDMHYNAAVRPEGLTPPEKAGKARGNPGFIENFDWRYPCGPNEEGPPEVFRWVRMNEREGLDPMVELLCVADVLPPGVMRLMTRPAPISSMTWMCNLLTPQPRTDDGWWLLRSIGTYAEKGCSAQEMTIWNAAGEPIATGMQSVAVFG